MSSYENVIGGKLKLKRKGKPLDVKAGGVKKKNKEKNYIEQSSGTSKNQLSSGWKMQQHCRGRGEKGIDRMSELPTCIMHDILSNLCVKDELRACLVSKSWYAQLWPCLPPRTFNFVPISTGVNYTEQQLLEFIYSVETSFQKLHNEKFILAAFNISLEVFNRQNVACVDGWLRLAVKHGLRRLCIHFPRRFFYRVRTGIVSASVTPLKELELTHCSLSKESLNDGDAGALALKRLSMIRCLVDRYAFPSFISRCTSLEYFHMDDCGGVLSLHLGELSKLKELDVKIKPQIDGLSLEKVDVDSLSLETIRIVCSVLSSPSMVVNFTQCRNLQHLHLCHLPLETLFLRNLATTCPLLHMLYLESCYGLESPTVLRHPLLQTIRLFSLPDSYDIRVTHTPNLLSLELNSEDMFQTSLCLPDKSSIPSPLKQFCLNLNIMCPLYTGWFIQFRAYLVHAQKNIVTANLNVSLCVYTCMHEFDVDITSEGLYDHPCHVEELRIHMRQSLENYATFFDSIFWSCRPKNLIVKLDGPIEELLKCIHDEIVMITREGDSTCCMSCWRHFVKVMTFNGTDASDLTSVLQNQSSSEEIVLTLDWS